MPQRFVYRGRAHKLLDHEIYCGRPSVWGNPFVMKGEVDRDIICDKHEDYVDHNIALKQAIKRELRGKDLGCWCKLNKRCHVDYLLKVANE